MDKYTVRGTDGSVDVGASSLAYSDALKSWVIQNEIDSEKIESAIEAIFDRFPGQRLPMPSLLSYAVADLAESPSQHASVTARCHAYVKGQCSNNTGRIDIGKGKGGGVMRLSLPGQPIPARLQKKSV